MSAATVVRSLARRLCLCGSLAGLLSCSVVAAFPSPRPEDDAAHCQNGVDDDLNGRLDCAELSCADFCPVTDAVRPANLLPCYSDRARSLSFVAQLGDLTQDARCSPWLPAPSGAELRPVCPEGEFAFPGDSGCAPLGASCPDAGSWPVDVAAGALYVRADAVAGGTGSADAPFSTVAEALTLAGDGDTVILGPGLYVEPVDVTRAITLRGVCADLVRLRSEGDGPVVRLAAAGAVLQDLTVGVATGADEIPVSSGVMVQADARLDSVAIRGVSGTALSVLNGASLGAERLDVSELSGADSIGIDVQEGASAELHAWALEHLDGDGVRAAGTLRLNAGWLADIAGVGLRALPTSLTQLRGLATSATLGGVLDVDCGARPTACMVAEDLWLDADGGPGITLRGGKMELRRASLERAEGVGLHVVAGTMVLGDVAVSQVRSRGVVPGAALRVESDGAVRGARVLLRLNLLYGVELLGGAVLLSDLMVDGRVPSGTSAVGIRVEGGTISLQAFSVDQAGICGIELVGVDDAVLSEGVVSRSPRGVCVDGGDLTPGELMSFIKFTSDVQRPVFVEGG